MSKLKNVGSNPQTSIIGGLVALVVLLAGIGVIKPENEMTLRENIPLIVVGIGALVQSIRLFLAKD